MSLLQNLVVVGDSILVAIDVQESFLAKLPDDERRLLLNRMGWLIEVSRRLEVPIVVTAENMASLGKPVPQIAARLPSDVLIHDKNAFDLTAQPEILSVVRATGRHTAILVGLETDVCVAQSALGLLDCGFQVVIIADATASPGTGHETGLERVRRAGALVMSVKSLYYEWMRTVDRSDRFHEQQLREIDLPDGVEL